MTNLFEENPIPKDQDGERTCGNCLERKPTTEFYKDGKDANGEIKYRRDCKQCYRVTRLSSRRAKRKPIPTTQPKKGRKK